jgi:hypothetical protein
MAIKAIRVLRRFGLPQSQQNIGIDERRLYLGGLASHASNRPIHSSADSLLLPLLAGTCQSEQALLETLLKYWCIVPTSPIEIPERDVRRSGLTPAP